MTDAFSALAAIYDLGERHTGALSIVFKAYDRKFDRDVAIKIPNDSVTSNPKYMEKFVKEARTLGRMNHPNIVSAYHFYEAGELDDRCYLVTEWLDSSLDRAIQNSDLSLESVVFFGTEILKDFGQFITLVWFIAT